MRYQFVTVAIAERISTVTLNNPPANLLNQTVLNELDHIFGELEADPAVRVVILTASGRSFCAGADVDWMRAALTLEREANEQDAMAMADMFEAIDTCPVPVIARVHGAALGGGMGLCAVSDLVIAESGTLFGFTETRLGILPAVISPYVIAKIGQTHARALFLTGERFDAERAMRVGLVHRVVEDTTALDAAVTDTIEQIKTAGPEAVRECKKLIAHVASHDLIDAIPYTIEAIATRRVSEEGQAGMNAFLKKDKPPWVK